MLNLGAREVNNYFGSNLKFLRNRYNISVKEIASMLNYESFSTITKWEECINTPPIAILQSISKMFGISIDELVTTNLMCELPINYREHKRVFNEIKQEFEQSENTMSRSHNHDLFILNSYDNEKMYELLPCEIIAMKGIAVSIISILQSKDTAIVRY